MDETLLTICIAVALSSFVGTAAGMFVGCWIGSRSMIAAVKNAFDETVPEVAIRRERGRQS